MPKRNPASPNLSLCSGRPRHWENARGELLIVGASARAAAQSAVAAGYNVTTIDLFSDADLCEIAESHIAHQWPEDVPRLAESIAPRDWMYTGGLENYPHIITLVNRHHNLLGCSAERISEIRDPVMLWQELSGAGFRMPATWNQLPPTYCDETWLRKPRRSAGGLGIRRIAPQQEAHAYTERENGGRPARDHASEFVFQREVWGDTFGAVFLAGDRKAKLCGITRQLSGTPHGAPGEFQYCGSIGPVSVSGKVTGELKRLADFLVDRFALRGLFGLDFIIAEDSPWLIEVNPRYPASAEVLERCSCASVVHEHCVACCSDSRLRGDLISTDTTSITPTSKRLTVGKLVLYACKELRITRTFSEKLLASAGRDQDVADIPRAGSVIEQGQPILTAFANGTCVSSCHESLQTRKHRLQQELRAAQLIRRD
ncbi:MAG: ATP-grasp domain-containing protein [Pirellulales bacterium]|nr:ATP-grasp domain-containing protein [Pirellulales bacterium]